MPSFSVACIVLRLGEFDQRHRVVQLALEACGGAEPILELGPLAHDLLRGFGVVPEIGIFDLGVQFGEAAGRGIDVKDASSAIPWTA